MPAGVETQARSIKVSELGCGASPGKIGEAPRTAPGIVKLGEAHQGCAKSRLDLSAARHASIVQVAPWLSIFIQEG